MMSFAVKAINRWTPLAALAYATVRLAGVLVGWMTPAGLGHEMVGVFANYLAATAALATAGVGISLDVLHQMWLVGAHGVGTAINDAPMSVCNSGLRTANR